MIHGNVKNMERSALHINLLKDFVDPHLTTVAGREFQGLTTWQEKKLCLIDECASGTSSRSLQHRFMEGHTKVFDLHF